jgi:hypothetical protein
MSPTKKILFTLGITGLVILGSCSLVHAYTVDQLATAIGKAENSKSHPYGIMVKYAHTSPRNACKNTVMHQYRNWLAVGQPSTFIHFLAIHYAPINCNNDNGTNKYWENNVKFFLKHLYNTYSLAYNTTIRSQKIGG